MSAPELRLSYLWPFASFRDASRGTPLERAAAYRHNRRLREQLPGCLGAWLLACAAALALTRSLDPLSSGAGPQEQLCVVIAACLGSFFAVGACMIAVLAYAWLYLGRHEH